VHCMICLNLSYSHNHFDFPELTVVINSVVEAAVSLNRLQSFFLCDEHRAIGPGSLSESGIRIENLSAAYDSKRPRVDVKSTNPYAKSIADKDWEIALLRSQLSDAERCIQHLSGRGKSADDDSSAVVHMSLLCLSRINFELKPGELVAVVGSVGSGKSSFINSMLGEVRQLTGRAAAKGDMALFCQIPFILNATVKENILFGHVYDHVDEERYQRALSCCALRHDLELLPDGDQTEIGEKGITLSGGQKARVALARAVYHQARITLIDDALSAVDAHVAKELFNEAILDELMQPTVGENKRSVVLVTNALYLLNNPRVDRIVVLNDGCVAEEGTYADLTGRSDSHFARFLMALSETSVGRPTTETQSKVDQSIISTEPRAPSFGQGPQDEVPKSKKLMSEEARETGQVGFKVYVSWFKAAGGLWVPAVVIISFTATEAITVLSNWWLTYWSRHDSESQWGYLGVYALINLTAAIAGLLRMLFMSYFGWKASREVTKLLLVIYLENCRVAELSLFLSDAALLWATVGCSTCSHALVRHHAGRPIGESLQQG
jgi:ABC-type glutathione transport system ATPase component